MNCNLIRIPVEYTDKKGESKKGNNYYIEFPNGEFIAIQPVFTKSANDFVRLRAFSDLRERK